MSSLRSRFKGPNAEERFIKARDAARARALEAIRRKRAGDPVTLKLYEVYVQLADCHTTDEIRGLLCNKCNLMIGHARDSVDILLAAIEYLQRDAYTGLFFAEATSVPEEAA